jgi:predicted transcriptional regulator YheO
MQDLDVLLAAARTMAATIGDTFGSDCEVAVHDLRDPTRSLVHLENGHVTGRALGSPIRDLIFRVVPNLKDGADRVANYLTLLDDGRRLKSTTCVLRDAAGTPAVAVCINLDLTQFHDGVAALSRLTRVEDSPAAAESRGVPVGGSDNGTEVSVLLQQLVDNVIGRYGKDPASMSKKHRQQVISFLDGKGTFLIKGAVPLVARRLHISESSVYRYLDHIRESVEEARG